MPNETNATQTQQTGDAGTNTNVGGISNVTNDTNTGTQNDNGTKNFYDGLGLSDEHIGFLQKSGIKDLTSLIKSHIDTKAHVGADKNDIIKLPKVGDDGKRDLSEVYKALGRPEKPEDYKLAEGDTSKFFAERMHKRGITAEQAKGLEADWAEYIDAENKKAVEALATERATQVEALKTEWGGDFETNKAIAEHALAKFGNKIGFTVDTLNELGDKMGVNNVVKLFYEIGKEMGGVKKLTSYQSGSETKETAAHKLAEMEKNPEVYKKIKAGDAATMAEWNRLLRIKSGLE